MLRFAGTPWKTRQSGLWISGRILECERQSVVLIQTSRFRQLFQVHVPCNYHLFTGVSASWLIPRSRFQGDWTQSVSIFPQQILSRGNSVSMCIHLCNEKVRNIFDFMFVMRNAVASISSDGRLVQIIRQGWSFAGQTSQTALHSVYLLCRRHDRMLLAFQSFRYFAFPVQSDSVWANRDEIRLHVAYLLIPFQSLASRNPCHFPKSGSIESTRIVYWLFFPWRPAFHSSHGAWVMSDQLSVVFLVQSYRICVNSLFFPLA
jgi:hypothetical protein